MKQKISIPRFQVWVIILVILPLGLSAQEEIKSLTQKNDSTLSAASVSKHALYTGLGFGNNLLCMGSSISGDKPYYYGALTYGFNNEFFISASTFHLSALKPFFAFNTLSLNYSHIFNSWFDISGNISRYQVEETLTDTLFNSFFYGDLTLGIDWRLVYSKLSVGRIFSEYAGTYFQLRNSRYFQTPDFFNDKVNVSFDPYATVLFGTLTKIVTTEGTSTGIVPPYRTSGNGGRNSTVTGSAATSTTTTVFGLMEVDLGLPIAFNTDHFTIEAEPGLVIPLYSDTEFQSSKGFVFMVSCYFKIF